MNTLKYMWLKVLLMIFPLFISSGCCFAQTDPAIPLGPFFTGWNNIAESTIKVPGIKNISSLTPTVSRVTNATFYYDRLGRLQQIVHTMASPTYYDIVEPMFYDSYGRQQFKYLPYEKPLAGANSNYESYLTFPTNLTAYYSSSSIDPNVVRTTVPYSKTIFEASPLNRVSEQGAPGTVWQPAASRTTTAGRTVVINYGVNDASTLYGTTGYGVRLWKATPITAGSIQRTLSSSSLYTAGQLFLKITKDENWTSANGKAGTLEEYSDKEGRLICKRFFNLSAGVINVTSTYYVYDDMGNLSFVLAPGANPDNATISQTLLDQFCYQYRYDSRKRVIEKRIPGASGWTQMIYNLMNQLVFSQDTLQRLNQKIQFYKYDGLGRVIMTGISINATDTRANVQNVVNGWPANWESRDNSNTFYRYSNNSLPSSVVSMQVLTVNYYDDYSITGIPVNESASYSNKTDGLLTASLVNVLGTSNYLWTINYYDNEGRIVKQYKQHYQSGAVSTSNYDEFFNTYDFEGKLTASSRTHHNGVAANTIIANRYLYDHVGRKLSTYEKINADAEVLISQNSYNGIGQLISKALHNGLQTTSYTYNERGWLKKSTSPQFSFQLNYQDGTTPQYNGNIANQLWGAGSTLGSTFNYTYNNLNNLLSGAATGMSEIMTYDPMGNITTLNRDGVTRSYVYTGNRLTSTSGATGTGTYLYNAIGSATYDGRLGQTITYNDLNLPSAVTGPTSLSYTYDGAGNKLKRSSNGVTTDYVDGIQYSAGSIQSIQTETGIVLKSGTNYIYEYHLTDHLGNVRYTFYRNPTTGVADRLQSDDYYAFGLRKSGSPVSLLNKYLYNGKEIQDELGQYDYGVRFYDPVIGRWNVVDPQAEKSRRFSPYVYGKNSPIIMVDPDGMFDEYFGLNGKKIGEDENGANGKVRIVTDSKEVDVIKSNTKEGKITNSNDVKSGISTTKTVISESLYVLQKTADNGGEREEGSAITNDGAVLHAESGPSEHSVVNGKEVATSEIPVPPGNDNTSIHSHVTEIRENENGDYLVSTATKLGPADPKLFSHFNLNIIVGNLGYPTSFGSNGKPNPPSQGAVFYNRNGQTINQVDINSLRNIIKP